MNENVVKFFELYDNDEALRKRIEDAEAAYPGSLEIRDAVIEAVLLPVAKELGLPLREGVLARDGRATAHAAEGRAARIALAQESYRAGSRRLPPGEHILLIDDIITTGATIEKCAGLLKAQGAGTVTAAAVLRTPRPEEKKPAEKL